MSQEAVIAAMEDATQVRPAGSRIAPARFVVLAKKGRDPLEIARAIRADLAGFGASVSALSPLDPWLLEIVLPGRFMSASRGHAFEAAYRLWDRYDAETAEPEIFTNLFPAPPDGPGADGKGVGEEESADFAPWCWSPREPELDSRKRWALEQISAPEAWAFAEAQVRPSRGEGVVIAQPDTGIARHAALEEIERLPGYDFISGDADPTDPLGYSGDPGHGTATCSVAACRGAGEMSGSAPRATHMAIRAIESVVLLSQINVAKAIDFAVLKGAHVITMSLGGAPSFALGRALNRAVAADVIVLAAAGNCVDLVVYPARYEACIAVAGTDRHDKPWRGTCKGPDVDISAPGENVFMAAIAPNENPGTRMEQGQGTSFAVALTAGVAACWLAYHGRANLIAAARARAETLQAMFRRLAAMTARRPGSGWDAAAMGAGVIDAKALLAADLGLGRERETAEALEAADSAALGARRLTAEALAVAAADPALDWRRYGQEVAVAILEAKRRAPGGGAAIIALEAALGGAAPFSASLEAAPGFNALRAGFAAGR